MGLEPQPLRLERQGAPTGERIVERGQLVPVEQLRCTGMVCVAGARPAPALPNLRSGPLQHLRVRRVLPLHKRLDDPEQTLAFDPGGHLPKVVSVRRAVCCRSAAYRLRVSRRPFTGGRAALERAQRRSLRCRVGQQLVEVLRRVVDHLCKDDRPRRGQRAARPPQVQRRGMPVPNGLLASRGGVDGIERQRHLDQLSSPGNRSHQPFPSGSVERARRRRWSDCSYQGRGRPRPDRGMRCRRRSDTFDLGRVRAPRSWSGAAGRPRVFRRVRLRTTPGCGWRG